MQSLDYLKSYFNTQSATGTNVATRRWFMDGVATAPALVSDVFSTDEVNQRVVEAYGQQSIDRNKLKAAQLALDTVAGLKRDLRVQFLCAGDTKPRTAMDMHRMMAQQSLWAARQLDVVSGYLAVLEGGTQ